MSQTQPPRRRRLSREVAIGPLVIGGDHPVRVQSMTATDTADVQTTVAQIKALAGAGCEIVRLTVDTPRAARALPQIRARCNGVPLVADIHFNHKMALEAAPYVDKLRINPGNIGEAEHIRAVVDRANEFDLPIRVGVNQGSLERDIALKYGARADGPHLLPPEPGYPAEALVESALRNIELLEGFGFRRTIISVKSSDVPLMVRANRMLAEACDYPLHLGVTEAGTVESSNIKSSVGIGALLLEGIGDTVRVSIAARQTTEKIEEVRTGFRILQAAGLRQYGVEVISCPTCGRESQRFDTAYIARMIEKLTERVKTPVRVAVMGCAVNGPGEAAEADIGVVAAGDHAHIYRRGEIVERQVPFEEVLRTVTHMIDTHT